MSTLDKKENAQYEDPSAARKKKNALERKERLSRRGTAKKSKKMEVEEEGNEKRTQLPRSTDPVVIPGGELMQQVNQANTHQVQVERQSSNPRSQPQSPQQPPVPAAMGINFQQPVVP
jgi:hypothetical protein